MQVARETKPMTRQVSKPNIFWAPSLETARKIDDEDTVKSIETARYRFAASLADLERCYDEQAGSAPRSSRKLRRSTRAARRRNEQALAASMPRARFPCLCKHGERRRMETVRRT